MRLADRRWRQAASQAGWRANPFASFEYAWPGADEEDGTPVVVQPVGHHRSEGEPRLFARKGRKATDAAQVHQSARSLRERRLGDRGLVTRRASACVVALQ
jgi:hypothetical protein